MSHTKIVVAALIAIASSAVGHAQTTHLHVLSATVEADNRTVDVTLQNRGDKPVVCYVLAATFYDATGKALNPTPVKMGYDYVNNVRSPGQPNIIQPQQTTTIQTGFGSAIASADVKVFSVVYADRTAEGDPLSISLAFRTRQSHAAAAAAALELVSKYPSSPAEWASLRAKLIENRHAAGFGRLALLQNGLPDPMEWKRAVDAQKAWADFLASEAQGVINQ
jgi:hypothetical protein